MSERSIPTEVGDAVTSVGVGGTRDELRIVGTTGTTLGAVGRVVGPAGGAQEAALPQRASDDNNEKARMYKGSYHARRA